MGNSNMSDKASSTNPNLTWELSNGASASIRWGGGSNNYQLCVAYRNSDSSEDVIHPLITSAGLYLKTSFMQYQLLIWQTGTVGISEVGTVAL